MSPPCGARTKLNTCRQSLICLSVTFVKSRSRNMQTKFSADEKIRSLTTNESRKLDISEAHLWKMSCSARRSIFSTSSLSTFSLSLSSSCCVVSMQYSDVHKMLHVWHCSSSVNLITSPSFSRLWIRLLADAIVGCCLENFSSWPDKLSCLLILQQRHTLNSGDRMGMAFTLCGREWHFWTQYSKSSRGCIQEITRQ